MSNRVHYRALASNFAVGIGDDTPGVAHRRCGADIPTWGRGLGLPDNVVPNPRRHKPIFGGRSMSDLDDWDFAGAADAKVTIHAAVRYLLKNAAGGDRGDIVVEIIEIVRQAAEGLPVDKSDPFGNETPG